MRLFSSLWQSIHAKDAEDDIAVLQQHETSVLPPLMTAPEPIEKTTDTETETETIIRPLYDQLTLLPEIELHILLFCDIKTVMHFSYLNHEKYSLVHTSPWLWKQHTIALTEEENMTVDDNNWKAAYIRSLVAFDPKLLREECRKHVHYKNRNKTATRKDTVQDHHHCWEFAFGNNVMKRNAITYFEYSIDIHCKESASGNGFRIAVGAVADTFKFFDVDHLNIVGQGIDGRNGFSLVIGTGQIHINSQYSTCVGKELKSGDVVGFLLDNGVTDKKTASIAVSVNGRSYGSYNIQHVLEYRPCIAMCWGQEVSLKKFVRK